MIKYLTMTRRTGLIDLFKEKGFKVGVEIGTDRGGYAQDICKRAPEIKLHTFDPWFPYTEGDVVKDEVRMQEIEKEARGVLSAYPNCVVEKATSMEAVKSFEDNSIDFVFIDGNHEYEYVYEDVVEWTKRVRPGGIVSGHDYVESEERKYGVVEAVNQYVAEQGIEPLYILRKDKPARMTKRGAFAPCWMFYKP